MSAECTDFFSGIGVPQPNRLTRAKLAAQDLINALPGDRVGLIAFAGNAFLQAPLTIDYSAVIGALNELDTNIIPRGGSRWADRVIATSDTCTYNPAG